MVNEKDPLSYNSISPHTNSPSTVLALRMMKRCW